MTRNRIQLILIVIAFALPAIVAVLLQTRWFHWTPDGTRNRGALIEPVLALGGGEAMRGLLANGTRWSVLARVPADCAAECARRLALLERVREAQGKEMDRVQMLAWAEPGAALSPIWNALAADADLASALDTGLALQPGEVLIVDPLGNAMLRYRANAEPTDVRKDLAHLLRWSKIGK